MSRFKDAVPHKEYKYLLVQFNALKRVVTSLEQLNIDQYNKILELEEKLKLVNEDEWNAKLDLIEKLTNELEKIYDT